MYARVSLHSLRTGHTRRVLLTHRELPSAFETRSLYFSILLYGSSAARHMITTLGFMSAPPLTLNAEPGVDYKVYLDMQMHLLANDPVLFGLYGIQWYHNGYVDEEILRWSAKLFRHYGIEGRKDGP